MPTSWDQSIAISRHFDDVKFATWSPCSKFIAIYCNMFDGVVILDATTLEQLHPLPFKSPHSTLTGLKFSPDGHLLTGYTGYGREVPGRCIATWDLQTGGLMGYITLDWLCGSITYSECGTMLGGYSLDNRSIIIYNILSGTQIFSHSVTKCIIGNIWTHGEYIQYAVVDPRSITTWEVSFTSNHPPVQVKTLPTPDNFPDEPKRLVFLPVLSLLAFTLPGRILVWDAQHQKILLDSIDIYEHSFMSFSPDGQLFIYESDGQYFSLCKKTSDGYLPFQQLLPNIGCHFFLISPDQRSIISSSGSTLQLWHTNSLPSLQSIPSLAEETQDVYLGFLSDELSIAIAEPSQTITILDLRSGDPQMIIDAGMGIYGMGIIGSKLIVVGWERSIIWELPAANHIFGANWDVNHSIQTIEFEEELEDCHISISPNLDYMVGVGPSGLNIFNMHTGERLDTVHYNGDLPGFTLDGDRVWCASEYGGVEEWEIVEDETSGTIELEYLGRMDPLVGFPWHSSCGYQVTDDGWILNSRGKRLLWLPHQWRSNMERRRWGGKILALVNTGLLEILILELEI